MQDRGLGILLVQTTAAVSLLSSFLSLTEHAVTDRSSLISSILHRDPNKHATATEFLNSHYFRTFWALKIKKFFPLSSHLTTHLQSLFEEMELDSMYGLFMPVLNHKLMDVKVKFLNVFRPGDFEEGAALCNFPTVLSLMEVNRIGHKTISPQN